MLGIKTENLKNEHIFIFITIKCSIRNIINFYLKID